MRARARLRKNLTEDENEEVGDDYKMLLVVRMDLKMGKGKFLRFLLNDSLSYIVTI